MRFRTYILILIISGLLVYINSLSNKFIGDDYDQIVRSTAVHSFLNIPKFFTGSTYESGGKENLIGIYYRPVMLSAFSLIASIFGKDPFYFHLFQVFLHIANSVLVFVFLRYFSRQSSLF